ncbi:toxin Cry1Ac domain D-VI-related protein [Enterococcus sp. AZ126]|uniref:toxin Cry1Ac domain D-VI-related protein n=1 Tax=Enterococcus sp. AZ126 TaxID=2774635 RepID=UPI003F23A3DC
MKVKKIFTTLLTTTLISQSLLPIMQVRAEETQYAENGQTVGAKAEDGTVASAPQSRTIEKPDPSEQSDEQWIAYAKSTIEYFLKDGVNSTMSDKAVVSIQDALDHIKNSPDEKKALISSFEELKRQFYYNRDLEASVNDLFYNGRGAVKAGLNRYIFDDLRAKLPGVVNKLWRDQIAAVLDAAWRSYNSDFTGDKVEKNAKDAVNNLFTDSSHTALKDTTTQATIDAAKKLVNEVIPGGLKNQLTAEIKKAQDLLDNKNQSTPAEQAAKEAVNNLFTDSSHTALKETTTQATIDAAKKLVDALPTGEVKTQLTAEIKKAQDLLDNKNQSTPAEQAAKEAVNDLFTDSSHTALKETTTQATIDAAKKLVDALPTGEVKTQLTAEIKKAQDLLSAGTNPGQENDDYWIAKATEILDYILKDGVGQNNSEKSLKEAENYIEKIQKNTTKKAELSKLAVEARRQFNYNKELEASVNNLFLNSSTLNPNVTQGTIDSLRAKLPDVVNKSWRNAISQDIGTAQLLLDKKNQEATAEKAAKDAVNNLFTDSSHTALKETTTQATIDAAKKLVDALPTGEVKTQLTAEIKKAQELLDKKNQAAAAEKAAKDAVNNLFTTDAHTALKDTTTQATIDAAKKLVDALPTGEVKTQLTAEIKKAQELLDKKNQAAAAEKAAKEAVNNLFTTDAHTALKDTTTQATIDAAKKLVDALPTGEVKTQLTAEIKKAQELLDKKNQASAAEKAAKEAVNNLFTDDAHTALKETTTQATIDAAKKLVDALPTGEVKTQLTAEIKKAQDLLGTTNDDYWIAKAIDVLNYLLNEGVAQAMSPASITEAEEYIGKIQKNTTKKAELSKLAAEARRQYNYNDGLETSIINLFLNNDVMNDTKLKLGVTQATIDILKAKLSGVVNDIWRSNLTSYLNKAQRILDKDKESAAEQAAKIAVNYLFTDASHTALKDTTTQAIIDGVKELVDALPSGEVKTQLTAEIKKAQELLDKRNQASAEKAAKDAVNNLFTDDAHTALKETTTQATIDAAKKLVDALPTGEVKTQLTAEIKKAQELLDKKNQASAAEKAAKDAVNNLFTTDAHTALKETTTQATIDAAKKLVDALPSGEVKTQLTAEIKKAQELLDKKNQASAAEQAAKEAVNNLFTDDAHTALKETTTQATIDAAKKLVDALPTGEVKTQLTAEIKKAQELLDKKNQAAAEKAAKDAVNNLFTDDAHTALKETTTQATIDAAKKLVDALPTGEVKTQLTAEIKKAQELLDKKNEEESRENAVKEEVNDLFANDAHTALKETTTQATIDETKKLVNTLPAGEVKTQLMDELQKAQELLDKKNQALAAEKAAKEAVDKLFTNETHKALNSKTTQATIDAAKKLVDALPTGEVKTQLTAEIKKAQALLGLVNDSKIDVDNYEMGSSRYVKGTISGKAIKKVALEINGELKKAINASTGPFQYWAVGQIMTEKDQVFVIGLDTYGNEIKRTKVNIIPAESTVNLTVSAFVIGKDNYITGTYEGNVKTVALKIDGVLTQKIAVKDGVIKYYAKGKILKSSSKVELVAIDVLGKEIASKAVKVSDVIASMKVNLYKLGEGYIQGTYTGDAKYMAIEVNGRMLQTIGITNGVLKYYAKGKINSVDDKVNIILLDGNKTEIQRTPLKM